MDGPFHAISWGRQGLTCVAPFGRQYFRTCVNSTPTASNNSRRNKRASLSREDGGGRFAVACRDAAEPTRGARTAWTHTKTLGGFVLWVRRSLPFPPVLTALLTVDHRTVNNTICLLYSPWCVRTQAQTGLPDEEYILVKPFGGCSDDVCFEQEKVDFIAAVDTLGAAGGGDTPESQTIALVRAAEDWLWREGVLKVRRI